MRAATTDNGDRVGVGDTDLYWSCFFERLLGTSLCSPASKSESESTETPLTLDSEKWMPFLRGEGIEEEFDRRDLISERRSREPGEAGCDCFAS